MTNGDRLRAMSDEELARADFFLCKYPDLCGNPDLACEECILMWLRAEVTEGE